MKLILIVLFVAQVVKSQHMDLNEDVVENYEKNSDDQHSVFMLENERASSEGETIFGKAMNVSEKLTCTTSRECDLFNGVCQKNSENCDGFYLKSACIGHNCECCAPTPKCKENDICREANGVCQKKEEVCLGRIIEDGCANGNNTCVCCADILTTLSATTLVTTELPTTQRPTTELPTTERPTTELSTTEIPTTERPTTELPTTERPTTELSTTEIPTTERPTTTVVPTTTEDYCELFNATDLTIQINELFEFVNNLTLEINATMEGIRIQTKLKNFKAVATLSQQLTDLFAKMDEIVNNIEQLEIQYAGCLPPSLTTSAPYNKTQEIENLKGELSQILDQIVTIRDFLKNPNNSTEDAAKALELKTELRQLWDDMAYVIMKLKELQAHENTNKHQVIPSTFPNGGLSSIERLIQVYESLVEVKGIEGDMEDHHDRTNIQGMVDFMLATFQDAIRK